MRIYFYRYWKIIATFALCFLSAGLADQSQLLWPVLDSTHLHHDLFSYLHSLRDQVDAQICAHQRPDCGAKISIPKSSCRINIWGLSISSENSTNKSTIFFWLFNFLNTCPGKAIFKITQILLLKPKVIVIFTTHVVNDVFAIWEFIIAYRNTAILSYNL